MDLDYLLKRHQASLGMVEGGACERARAAHKILADGYAAMIARALQGSHRSLRQIS